MRSEVMNMWSEVMTHFAAELFNFNLNSDNADVVLAIYSNIVLCNRFVNNCIQSAK